MSAIRLSEKVYWVGAVDAGVRDFHGYKTPYGTTYNSYLILDEKITLIDFVKEGFTSEHIRNIEEIVPLERLDVLVANHIEPDHSGSLPAVAARAKNAVLLASPNGKKGLEAYYGLTCPIRTVKSGESYATGAYTLMFTHIPMVHWPDSMVTYLAEEGLLFSNDAFGQHIASDKRFVDELGIPFVMDRAKDYYANIVLPFGAQVEKALAALGGLKLSMIAPSHGQIWRSDIPGILEKYARWSGNATDPDLAVIIYDTMWGSTAMMADALRAELEAQGKTVRTYSLKSSHISEVMAGLLEAKHICVGSPTLNRGMMPNVAAFLTYMKGLAPKNRVGMAFGSYGWSGESVSQVESVLRECGFELLPMRRQLYRSQTT